MQGFWDVFPVIIIFPSFAIMLKWFLEYRLKQKLIDKGVIDEKVKYLNLASLGQYQFSSLKWGLVLTLIGITVVAVKAMLYEVSGEVILGAMLIAAGAGLLIYYFIADVVGKKSGEQLPNGRS